jgi:uncharacterized Ntn-hydrolase superfamily protein
VLDLATFSIAARDRRTGDVGVAVATARPNVGSLVPFASRRGAIATQARVNTDLGRQGLALLTEGVPIGVALPSLLAADDDRDLRQLHGVDAGGGFAHTGARCVPWCGHRTEDDLTAAGNMLAGAEVLDAMVSAYRAADPEGDLPGRLLAALTAGQGAGGDRRGKRSAALLVASAEPRLHHNLRVDDHPDPVAELRRIHDRVVAHVREIAAEHGPEGVRLFGRVKY